MPDRTQSAAPRPAPSLAPAGALEQPACPLCGEAAGGKPKYRFPPYGVTRCPRCGFWYLRPRVAETRMRDAYSDEAYFEGGGVGYRSYLAQEPTLRLTFRRFLRRLAARGIGAGAGVAGGRLLEVGCAYGFFLEEARASFGYRAGTDYSAAALAITGARADRTYLGGLEAVAETEPFDCVACIHVIEHIYDPRRFVSEAFDRLRPGGWMVLATPNMGGPWRRLMGRRWPFFKAPEHVTYFDRRSVRRLLGGCGFTSVQMVPYASVFSLDMIGEKLGWRAPAFARGMRFWLPGTTIAAAGRKPVAAGDRG